MPPKQASLRNEDAFPMFEDLPEDYKLSRKYHRSVSGFKYEPRKHWCMLAEIVDVHTVLRLIIDAKDKSGRIFRVAFYTHGRGYEWKKDDVKPGHSLAILYPYQRVFLDMTTGVRVGDTRLVKVIPAPLDNLLRLSDDIQSGVFYGNSKRCHGCGKEKEGLKKCAICELFWYCDKACQTVGWKEKGHKADCKALQDADLQKMLRIRWGRYNGCKSFPLSS